MRSFDRDEPRPEAGAPRAADPGTAPSTSPRPGPQPPVRPRADGETFSGAVREFLELFARRYGTPSSADNGDALVEVPAGLLGPDSPGGSIRLPLAEDRLMQVALEPHARSANPARLLALCMGRGALVSLRARPRLEQVRARAILGEPHPKVVHRPVLAVHVLLTLRHFRREQSMQTFVYDVESGSERPDLVPLLAPEHWLDGSTPALDLERHRPALRALHDRALGASAAVREERLARIRAQLDRVTQESIQILDDYYEEKARELENERRSIYFHLYYFEKEQEIDQKLAHMKKERAQTAQTLRTSYDLTAQEELKAIGYFEVPFFVSPGSGRAVDALTGSVVLGEGGEGPG